MELSMFVFSSANLACALLLAAITVAGCRHMKHPGPEFLAILETPQWRKPGTLRMRFSGNDLLLRQDLLGAADAPIYRYRSGAESLEAAAVSDWNRATGHVNDCGRPLLPPLDVVSLDAKTRTLRRPGGAVLSTAGRAALDLRISPDRRELAVLSADGSKVGSLLPFLGGGSYSGTHYHQTFAYPELSGSAPAIPLPRQRETDILTPCWAMNRFVVYVDSLFSYAIVVPIKRMIPQNASEVLP